MTEGQLEYSFQTIANRFKAWYGEKHPVATTLLTARGSSFQASFAKDLDHTDDDNVASEKPANRGKRNRSSTSATIDRLKTKSRCAACDMLHDLSQCWLAIEAIRPSDWVPTQRKIDGFEKRLKKDKAFAAAVEKARKEH